MKNKTNSRNSEPHSKRKIISMRWAEDGSDAVDLAQEVRDVLRVRPPRQFQILGWARLELRFGSRHPDIELVSLVSVINKRFRISPAQSEGYML
jgi:hypothetical protein